MSIRKVWTSVLVMCLLAPSIHAGGLQKVGISYPNGGFSWPLFIAKDARYFEKNGLDVGLAFGVHPADIAMLVSGEVQVVGYALEPLMVAASKDKEFVMICSPINRGVFALMARPDLRTVRQLKGMRLSVGQIGDANYGYATVVLRQAGLSPRDVEWVPLGPDTNSRVAAMMSGRVDAALLTAPAYFKLEAAGFRNLVNFAERKDLFASAALLMKRSVIMANPELPGRIIKAQAEAIKRFYDDKPFAVQAFMHYNRAAQSADVERLYELYARSAAFERIPFLLTGAVAAAIDQEADENIASQLRAYDFRSVIDNSFVQQMIVEGAFQRVFGHGIAREEQQMEKSAFNLSR